MKPIVRFSSEANKDHPGGAIEKAGLGDPLGLLVSWCNAYVRQAYNVQTVLLCFKEFAAVLVQLVCFARLGPVDLFNGSLLLYMVLIVFSFPFLNSYLFGFLRFGMWWVYHPSVLRSGSAKISQEGWFARTVMQFICVTVSQTLGAYAAALTNGAIQARWKGVAYHALSDTRATPIVFVNRPPDGGPVEVHWLFLEEFCAVGLLLVGLLHLIHCDVPDLVMNAYWKHVEEEEKKKEGVVPEEEEEDEAAESVGFTSETDRILSAVDELRKTVDDMHQYVQTGVGNAAVLGMRKKVADVEAWDAVSLEELKRTVDGLTTAVNKWDAMLSPTPGGPAGKLRPLPKKGLTAWLGSNADGNVADIPAAADANTVPSADKIKRKQPSKRFPAVPATLVVHAALLVAALSRAFPTAHQSLHLSLYFWFAGLSGDRFEETGYRVLGGYAATLAALAYYWVWFVLAGAASGDHATMGQRSLMRRNYTDRGDVFMRSECRLLRLPDYAQLMSKV